MYLFQTESERIKGLVTNYAEGGGGAQNGRGGHVKFDPFEKGGAEKVLAMLKRGWWWRAQKGFGVVFTQ